MATTRTSYEVIHLADPGGTVHTVAAFTDRLQELAGIGGRVIATTPYRDGFICIVEMPAGQRGRRTVLG